MSLRDHPNNQAYALHLTGNPKEALPYYKKSVKVIEKAVCSGSKGKCGHADVANGYRNLASCYLDLGSALRAADYDKKADAVFAEKARIKDRAKTGNKEKKKKKENAP